MSLGQKGSTNPAAILTTLLNKRQKLQEELRSVERQVYELETSYLQESSHFGNALKGYEGFLSSSKSTTSAKRSKKFQPEDRIFSLSSVTSPAAEELGVVRDDGRADVGSGRSRGGAFPAGQGKPKKGRAQGATRDSKRSRPSDEQDFDNDDDPDMTSR